MENILHLLRTLQSLLLSLKDFGGRLVKAYWEDYAFYAWVAYLRIPPVRHVDDAVRKSPYDRIKLAII